MDDLTDKSTDWPEENEKKLLEILIKRVQRDRNGAPSFKKSDWDELDEALLLETGEKCGAKKIKGKCNRLREKHRHFSELLNHTGVTYDSNSNVVFAPEDVWQIFYKFKRRDFKNYELYGQVFD